MVILKPVEQFCTYKYKNKWMENHEKNYLLNEKVDWKLNMLWSEKINFVMETIKEKYFDTEYYGWCDIGYFRNRPNDLNIGISRNWPSPKRINALFKNKIYYACINNNNEYINQLKSLVKNKNENGLPNTPIPPDQLSIAGGFFISHKQNLDWWHNEYYTKLKKYFDNNYLVKDDQIIVADCVFTNAEKFHLCKETAANYDNWFLFQRFLL
jgi:hypothetical protein